MTTEEKAKELVEKFITYNQTYIEGSDMHFEDNTEDAKECALICVDEIIEEVERTKPTLNNMHYVLSRIDYWRQVKQEIEKL